MSGALTDLLNKVLAICRCRAGTATELAKFIGKRPQQIHDWIVKRSHEPSGRVVLEMQTWASGKTLAIAASDRKLQSAYRREYKKACQKFPVSGRK